MAVVVANEVACVVLDVEWNEYAGIRGVECKCCCGAISCFCTGSILAPGMLRDCGGGGGKGGCMRWYDCGTERSGIGKFMAMSVNVAMTRLASVAHCVFCSGSTGRLTLTVVWKCRKYSPCFFCFFQTSLRELLKISHLRDVEMTSG